MERLGGVDLGVLVLGGLVIVIAAVVQSTMGLGLMLVGAPVITLLDASLMPGGLLVLGMALPVLTVIHEWRHVNWRQAGWLTGARAVTTPLGVLLLGWLSARAIGAVVGVVVLVAVGLTAWKLRVATSRRNLIIAGAIAGVSGTAASIGGPPAAVVLQHEEGPRLRATLGAFFVVGSLVSLCGLAIGGELTAHQLAYGAVWLPALAIGFAVAVPLQKRLNGPRLRQAVLTLAAASSIVVILRSVL
ncbi:sulfite exporter TauE/SafE family protein [Kribbella lupini]|uniref:Probable membrane transporter protein n=1 Tax=Kribbella lupini TaxID=291602 RepID=A0ABN2ACD6_9ACTN